MQQFWVVRGYHSFEEIFTKRIPYASITEDRLIKLLKCLAAKEGLTLDEIVDAYTTGKDGTPNNQLLAVQQDSNGMVIQCGDNPYFVAKLENDI